MSKQSNRWPPSLWRVSFFLITFCLTACEGDSDIPGRDDDERRADAEQPLPPGERETDQESGPLEDQSVAETDLAPVGCEQNIDCAPDEGCIEGVCVQVECRATSDCSRIQACWQGECRDRCFGDNTCFRGGVCFRGVCIPEECEEDDDCPDGELCRRQLCVEPSPCGGAEDCEEGEACLEGNCEPLPSCGGDGNCSEGEICVDGRCEVRPACEGSEGCEEGSICIGGLCVPDLCRGSEDCNAGERCNAGSCEPIPTIEVLRVIILNRPQSLLFGQQLQLRAVALDEEGVVVAAEGFVWSVNPGDAASIDELGLLTVGELAGELA